MKADRGDDAVMTRPDAEAVPAEDESASQPHNDRLRPPRRRSPARSRVRGWVGRTGVERRQQGPFFRGRWRHVVTFGVLPLLIVSTAAYAGYLKWQEVAAGGERVAAAESQRAATDGAVAMLSYRADTVQKDLGAASDLLTGPLRDSYNALIEQVVIPGSREKRISATARVVAAAPVSLDGGHAIILLFVDQSTTFGDGQPTTTGSAVRVTLDDVDGRWLISGFDPV